MFSLADIVQIKRIKWLFSFTNEFLVALKTQGRVVVRFQVS